MRKLLASLITFLLIHSTGITQTRIGITAGGNLSNITWKQFSNKQATRFLPGYQLGFTVTSPLKILSRQIHIQPGLLFSRKGFQQNYSDYLGNADYKVRPYYIELPVNLLYLIPNKNDKNVFVGLGPYVACGIEGQWEIKYHGNTGNFVGDIEYADINDQKPPRYYIGDEAFNYGKRIDYGVNMLAGYELWGNLQVQAHGQLGLRNLAPPKNGVTGNEYFKNISLGLSLNYLL
ncbi:porin family protein [Niabella hibiscisoli]|uniref:porin family protein n=1 Tax=Niabella hibiscisoli TaxID=1825928 RepID=UPI001F112672|nr:porin family protein [Niabella hibiscisoli]MCH5719123.1 PorT family protein [Niabella hibiscisoli]